MRRIFWWSLPLLLHGSDLSKSFENDGIFTRDRSFSINSDDNYLSMASFPSIHGFNEIPDLSDDETSQIQNDDNTRRIQFKEPIQLREISKEEEEESKYNDEELLSSKRIIESLEQYVISLNNREPLEWQEKLVLRQAWKLHCSLDLSNIEDYEEMEHIKRELHKIIRFRYFCNYTSFGEKSVALEKTMDYFKQSIDSTAFVACAFMNPTTFDPSEYRVKLPKEYQLAFSIAAAYSGCVESFKYFTEQETLKMLYDRFFIVAAEGGSTSMLDHLFKSIKYSNKKASLLENALRSAAKSGHVEVMKWILSRMSQTPSEYRGEQVRILFSLATCLPHLGTILFILNTFTITFGYLEWNHYVADASRSGNIHILDFLIKYSKQAKIDFQDNLFFIEAAAAGRLNVIKYFMGDAGNNSAINPIPGVKPAAQNNAAIIQAALNSHFNVVEYLLQLPSAFDIDLSAQENLALRLAARQNKPEVIDYLLSYDVWSGEFRINGMNPAAADNESVVVAMEKGHLECLKVLIEKSRNSLLHSVDLMARNNAGFLGAIKNNHLDMVKYLLSNGFVDIALPKHAPLITACEYGHLDIVKFMMSKNNNGQYIFQSIKPSALQNKALISAISNRHYDVVEFFLSRGPFGYRRFPDLAANLESNSSFKQLAMQMKDVRMFTIIHQAIPSRVADDERPSSKMQLHLISKKEDILIVDMLLRGLYYDEENFILEMRPDLKHYLYGEKYRLPDPPISKRDKIAVKSRSIVEQLGLPACYVIAVTLILGIIVLAIINYAT